MNSSDPRPEPSAAPSGAGPVLDSDVLVIGGGPAGSTTAMLLVRKGWSVTLLERDRHPRFHIGESLLPMNMPIFERLGVMDEISTIGVKKLGADFPSGNAAGYNNFRFRNSLNPTYPYAYQVRRSDFDAVLFRRAARSGVNALESTRVTDIDFHAEGVTAQALSENGGTRNFRARYLVDATGRDTFLGNRLQLKHKHSKHQTAALFAHFRGVLRRPGEDQGNISIYRFAYGWAWMIPLPDELMSVGIVCGPEYLRQRHGRNDEFLIETLQDIPGAAARMRDAEITGNLHATGNYSYLCSRAGGRNWIMVGDAYAFLDPIFSSGVYLAMNSAELAAEVVDKSLRDPAAERSLQRRYTRQIRGGLNAFSWFIFRFTSPAMRRLFANPSNQWQLVDAVISMLAGDVFRDGGVRWRLRLFKLIYLLTSLKIWRQSLRGFASRRRQAGASFSGGTTSQDPV